MSDKNLKILAIVAAVMVVLAVIQSRFANRTAILTKLDQPLIQGLDTSKIASIVLGQGEDTVTIKKMGKTYVVADKDNYPAQQVKINNLLVSVLDIKINEEFTSNPDNYEDLEVTEEKARNVVKFLDAQDNLLVGLIVGKRNYDQNVAYVRRLTPDENESKKVYTSSETPWLQSSATSYFDQDLYKVKKEDIARVTVAGPDGSYRLKMDENNKIVLQKPLPEGKKLKGTDYEQVFNAVTSLTFDDVRKESDKTADLKFDRAYVCERKDSTVTTFKLAKKDDKTYLKCESTFTEKVKAIDLQKATPEEIEAHDTKLKALEASQKFSKKHAGWIYEVSSWKADNMTKSFDDLLEDKKEEKKDTPAEEKTDNQDTTAPVEIPAKTEGEASKQPSVPETATTPEPAPQPEAEKKAAPEQATQPEEPAPKNTETPGES